MVTEMMEQLKNLGHLRTRSRGFLAISRVFSTLLSIFFFPVLLVKKTITGNALLRRIPRLFLPISHPKSSPNRKPAAHRCRRKLPALMSDLRVI